MHQMVLTIKDFKELCDRYPNEADLLNKLIKIEGPKAKLPLKSLTPEIKKKLSNKLIDYIYKKAYSLPFEKFASYYYQIFEVLKLPKSQLQTILEIGPGAGVFKTFLTNYEYELYTLDLIPDNNPDIIGNAMMLPFKANSHDLICSFQVLEHIPYDKFQSIIKEIVRCTKKYVYFSLPFPSHNFYFSLKLQLHKRILHRLSYNKNFLKILPGKLPDIKIFNEGKRKDIHNPHYWEINRKSYPKHHVLKDVEDCGIKIIKQFHNESYPYHFFILGEKTI